jgi:O-acetylserine/cysteine efflux transporter
VKGERPRPEQMLAAGVALAGIMLIGSVRLGGASFGPFLLVILAAASWGAGNLVGKMAGGASMFAFTIWSSLASPLPLLALSFLSDEPGTLRALAHPTWTLFLCVVWLSFGATILGFGLWSRLLSRYPASVVTPFALLIPVAGMAAGWLIFAEPLSLIEAVGALVVMAGLWINVFGERLFRGTAEARL